MDGQVELGQALLCAADGVRARGRMRKGNLKDSSMKSFDKLRKFVVKKAGALQQHKVEAPKLQVADYEEMRVQFETEKDAVVQLNEQFKKYRDNLLSFVETSTSLAYQISLFYGPNHPHRHLVNNFEEAHKELAEALTSQLHDVFNSVILEGPLELQKEFESVSRSLEARNEALNTVEKLERKHDTSTHKSVKEDKMMYTGEQLKEAINSFALLHERAVKGTAACHEKIISTVDPSLIGLIMLQSELYGIAHRSVAGILHAHGISEEMLPRQSVASPTLSKHQELATSGEMSPAEKNFVERPRGRPEPRLSGGSFSKISSSEFSAFCKKLSTDSQPNLSKSATSIVNDDVDFSAVRQRASEMRFSKSKHRPASTSVPHALSLLAMSPTSQSTPPMGTRTDSSSPRTPKLDKAENLVLKSVENRLSLGARNGSEEMIAIEI
eukprot:Plantae.Rhodophyta-Purpureofilum_apyrenoidigerum.ctg7927.p1 GENE.Plantae.Rhodophyta-Purpureofilum_apyrenoidigerum.ctg7927~~Plantae.Rhodophyta-Purpureofilum_apyrenoidigerum.ctg7927.p1  ORF type:complete len:440 (-),score=76.37 Plantae.Rhodophyta-Purpureofilum_apyrenoidigerum.ctg7927:639-1958(-)